MNPSAAGWITKLITELDQQNQFKSENQSTLYPKLRDCGFIYGNNIRVVNAYIKDTGFSSDEICKINLLIALLVAFHEKKSEQSFYDSIFAFYNQINQYKFSFFDEILHGKNQESTLEKIIHKRIQIDDNVLTKTFNYFLTNALLFVDVLAYRQFLKIGSIAESYLKQLEASIQTITVSALSIKKFKSQYDESLIKLLESSLRYKQLQNTTYEQAIGFLSNHMEAQYVLDMACMATWSDEEIDIDEKSFLFKLGDNIGVSKEDIENSIVSVDDFYSKNKNSIVLFTSKNAVKSFYDNSSAMVSRLISRNKKRLMKELKESKDLMILLTKSTTRELTEEEQKKLQDHLLDVFKTIPSLAIFMLPGGAILLPIVIKFIPKLLPSAFDDNRIKN